MTVDERPTVRQERVVVALTGAPWGEQLIRRAALLAAAAGGDLVGTHISNARIESPNDDLSAQRRLLIELGGSYREIVADDIAAALIAFARSERATQVVIGRSSRQRRLPWHALSPTEALQAGAVDFDVHLVATAAPRADVTVPRRRRRTSPIPLRRERAAWAVALVGGPVLTALLVANRAHLNLGSALLLQLALVVAIAVTGGVRPGVVASVAAFLSLNWFLTPPYHTLSIADTDDVVALTVFVAVSLAVSLLVDRLARRSSDAQRARAEGAALARMSGALVTETDPMPVLVDQLRALLGVDGVAVVRRCHEEWVVECTSGADPPAGPADGVALPLDATGETQLVLRGGPLAGGDIEMLTAFTTQLALGLETRRLRQAAVDVEALSKANLLRTALLQAVSHDLRTPLASVKAAVTGLIADDVQFTPDDRLSLLRTIDTSADRLDRVIGNLLDMGRLQSGSAQPNMVATPLEEVVAHALASLDAPAGRIDVDVSEELPLVLTDPALLERTVANLVSNALAWSPTGAHVRVDAGAADQQVALRIVDHGPGIPTEDRTRVFEPFQRRGDRSQDAGAGLGLAIAKGFVEVCGGSIRLDDTPGGGATFTVLLPLAEDPG